jgi:hypothetical protein
MHRIALITSALLLSACSSVSYQPVTQTTFDALASQGCAVANSRFNVVAKVSAAYKETVVLHHSDDATKTAAVRLPEEGLSSKAQGLLGDSRYELNLQVLRRLQESKEPATVNLLCKDRDRAPVMLRVRYVENGAEKEIEFKE